MHNKWYSLTRPAVVHFNPPRDRVLIGWYYGNDRRNSRSRRWTLSSPAVTRISQQRWCPCVGKSPGDGLPQQSQR